MTPLAFSLRVPGRDILSLSVIGSTRFRFRGLLSVDGGVVRLEWTGTAKVDEVGWTGIHAERLALPLEELAVPVSSLRTVQLRGGWLRPVLELTGITLQAFRTVPGEEAGRVQLWIARRDRGLARAIVTALRARATTVTADGEPMPDELPITTPTGGSA